MHMVGVVAIVAGLVNGCRAAVRPVAGWRAGIIVSR
jgi:hypothetical protein